MKEDSSANKAYSEIRRKVLSGQILPNTRIKEDAWAKTIAVGRMAVREALTRLLGEGLLTQGEKGGYFIESLRADNVEETRELRQILETGALELAVKKISAEQIKALEKICDDFTLMHTQGYFAGACEADIKFHETLIESSGNAKLISIYKFSHIPLFHQKLSRAQEFFNDYKQTDTEHRQIVTALKAKDISLARTTLVQHFHRGVTAILDL